MSATSGIRSGLWLSGLLAFGGMAGIAWGALRGDARVVGLSLLTFIIGITGAALATYIRHRRSGHGHGEGKAALELALIAELGRQDDETLDRIARTRGTVGDVAQSLLAERHRKRRT